MNKNCDVQFKNIDNCIKQLDLESVSKEQDAEMTKCLTDRVLDRIIVSRKKSDENKSSFVEKMQKMNKICKNIGLRKRGIKTIKLDDKYDIVDTRTLLKNR